MVFGWIKSLVSTQKPRVDIKGRLIEYTAGMAPRVFIMNAQLLIDASASTNAHEHHIVITDLDNDAYEFQLDESREFSRAVSTDKSDKSVAYCWKDTEDDHTWIIFVLDPTETGNPEATGALLQQTATTCIFDYLYGKMPSPDDEELYNLCGEKEFGFDFDTLQVQSHQQQPVPTTTAVAAAAAVARTPPRQQQVQQQPAVERTPPRQVQQQPAAVEVERTPPRAATVASAVTSPATTPLQQQKVEDPRTPAATATSSAASTPAKATSPAAAATPVSVRSSPARPLYPELADLDVPKPVFFDDEEDIMSAGVDLYLLQEDRSFILQRPDACACIVRVGEPKRYMYLLNVEDAEGERIFQQSFSSDMNPQYYTAFHSIIWNMSNPVSTWSVVFKDFTVEVEFKEQMAACLYESKTRLPWSKVAAVDRRSMVTMLQMDKGSDDSLVGMQEDDGYSKEDFMDFEEEEEEEEEEEDDEEEEEEEVITRRTAGKASSLEGRDKNGILVDSGKHGRTFVSRGNNIGIFKRDTEDAEFVSMIKNLTISDGTVLRPNKMMLHDGDRNILMIHPDQYTGSSTRGKVFKMDIERGKVVEEWTAAGNLVPVSQTAPIYKYAGASNESVFGAVNGCTIFGMDPRLSSQDKAVGNINEYTHRADPEFSCIATSAAGYAAVGSEKGEIRMLTGIPGLPNPRTRKSCPKMAKTLLPGFGDPIKAIDVTADARWILATCKNYLLVAPTFDEEKGDTGFVVRMGDRRPAPRRLQLKPEDLKKIGGVVNYTSARFNTGADGETWIVTSTGSWIIQWNFRKVQQNKLSDYTMKDLRNPIVDECFVNLGDGASGKDAPILVVLPDDVRLEKRKFKSENPFASNSAPRFSRE